MLERQMDVNRELTQSVINQTNKPEPIIEKSSGELKPISPSYIPWRVRQQMLQQEDRVKARIIKQSTEELETAVGLENAGPTAEN